MNDKRTLEDTIVDLSTSEKVSESDRTTHENEVKEQERAKVIQREMQPATISEGFRF